MGWGDLKNQEKEKKTSKMRVYKYGLTTEGEKRREYGKSVDKDVPLSTGVPSERASAAGNFESFLLHRVISGSNETNV